MRAELRSEPRCNDSNTSVFILKYWIVNKKHLNILYKAS